MTKVTACRVVWQERLEIDSGQAFQGPWRMNASQFLYVDDPAVVSSTFLPGERSAIWLLRGTVDR